MIEEIEIVIVIDEADEVVSEDQKDRGAVPVIEKDRVIVAKGILARVLQEHQRIN